VKPVLRIVGLLAMGSGMVWTVCAALFLDDDGASEERLPSRPESSIAPTGRPSPAFVEPRREILTVVETFEPGHEEPLVTELPLTRMVFPRAGTKDLWSTYLQTRSLLQEAPGSSRYAWELVHPGDLILRPAIAAHRRAFD